MAFLSVRIIYRVVGVNTVVVSWLNNNGEYYSPRILTNHMSDDKYHGMWFIRNDKLYLARYKNNSVSDLYITYERWLYKVHKDGSINSNHEYEIRFSDGEAIAKYYDNFNVIWESYDDHIMIVMEITFPDISTNAWTTSSRRYSKRSATCVFDKSTRRAYLINPCSSSSDIYLLTILTHLRLALWTRPP